MFALLSRGSYPSKRSAASKIQVRELRCLMWKKEDGKSQSATEISTAQGATSNSAGTPNSNPSVPRESAPATSASSLRTEAACISQGIRIKGEVTGSEDLFVDGLVDGKLSLTNGSLTIGPNGQVKADVTAREVIVRGKVEGRVSGRDKVALLSTGQVNGEVQTDRLAIEDGAMLRGKVEAGKQPKSAETHVAAATAAASASKGSGAGAPRSSGSAAN
jgi:cytoskeletal protein CcmA (bactofilin family)